MEREKLVKWVNRIAMITFIAIIGIGIYIMKNGIGLIEGLDFGPGSYYYTDIPGWKQIFMVHESSSFTNIPTLVYFILFFGWGYAMWKMWGYLDSKIK